MRPDKKLILDTEYLYRVARDFSNRLRIDGLLTSSNPSADNFAPEVFQERIVPYLYEDLRLRMPDEAFSREKLAKIVSLGCSGLPGERESMHIFERLAIDDAIGRYDAHRTRTPVGRMDEPIRHREDLPAGTWYARNGWNRMNGMQRLQYQAVLVIAAAIRDLAFAKYLGNKHGEQYTPQLTPALREAAFRN